MSNSVIPWTIACQDPLLMGFPRQEYWSGLPFPPPGDLPNPGIKLLFMSPALAGGFFTTSAIWEVQSWYIILILLNSLCYYLVENVCIDMH